jgi:putative hemolysin
MDASRMSLTAQTLQPAAPPDTGAAPRIARLSESQIPVTRVNYRTRLATTEDDILAAQRLRFEVFNVELREGLSESWHTQLDSDRFDATCDHLIIEHIATGKIVGTYRLQTGAMAAAGHGYYSAQEFDFTPFEPFRSKIVELGRACVHQDHRRGTVLDMLWRGIATYARERGARYLLGCSSLTTQDAALGHAMFAQLAPEFLAAAPFRTAPLPAFALPAAAPLAECPKPPRLLRTYLAVGAKICGAPALDRDFGTIDFLTLIDFTSLPAATSARFLS